MSALPHESLTFYHQCRAEATHQGMASSFEVQKYIELRVKGISKPEAIVRVRREYQRLTR